MKKQNNKTTTKKAVVKKDYNQLMKKILTAIIVLSCVIVGVTVIGIALFIMGVLIGVSGDAGGIAGIIFGALILVFIPIVTVPWVVLIIISLVVADKQTAFEPRNFRIFMGIILGFVVISVIASAVAQVINTDSEIVNSLMQSFGSLETIALIGSVVLSAVYIHQIKTKRA